MPTTSITVNETNTVLYTLRRADDALVLGHRLSEWTGHAPTLEEELALANIALDQIGLARALYALAATREGAGHDEDALAYLRDAGQFRNLLLVELPKGDFALTITRQFYYAAFATPYWEALAQCADTGLAEIGARAAKEAAYHLRHATEWLIRLGDGTAESHARAQAAVDALWPYTGEMFTADTAEATLVAAGLVPDTAPLRAPWSARITQGLRNATLTPPQGGWMQQGGRSGRHTEHLGHMLAEMQVLARTYPGAQW